MSTVAIVVRLAKVVELVLSSCGLTLNQYRALTLIEAGPPPMGEFAFRLAMEPPNASALVDGLVARSLVARGRDRADRRRVVLKLTARGRALLSRAEALCTAALGRVASFDAAKGKALIDGLESWSRALDEVAIDLRSRMNEGTLARQNARGGRRSPNAAARSRSRTASGAPGRPKGRRLPMRRSISAIVSGQ